MHVYGRDYDFIKSLSLRQGSCDPIGNSGAGVVGQMADQTSRIGRESESDLRALLDRALALADELELPLVAVRISEARDALPSGNSPGDEGLVY
jgi:hypothetical protein